MTTPLDIVTAALRASDDVHDAHGQAARARAGVAVDALTDDRVIEHAAQALHAAGWVPEVNADARAIAATVLQSVGEA